MEHRRHLLRAALGPVAVHGRDGRRHDDQRDARQVRLRRRRLPFGLGEREGLHREAAAEGIEVRRCACSADPADRLLVPSPQPQEQAAAPGRAAAPVAHHVRPQHGPVGGEGETEAIRGQETLDQGCEHDNRAAANGGQTRPGLDIAIPRNYVQQFIFILR